MGIFDASSLPSSPTSQQTNTPSIQSFAQPYISNYLNRAQSLANQGPSALQNQSYIGAANLSMPGAFGAAEGLATQAGQGQLASAPIAYGYGTQGSEYGKQGAGLGIAGGSLYGGLGANYGMAAGQNYANMATSPEAMQAYMNPYVQQSLKPQLDLLGQQQMLAAQGINAKAVGQGAFGGNRATLAQGLNAQNYDLARQQAIAQGYNTAYQQAQQAQQFGANLGLQGALGGAGVGLQGVGTQLAGTGQGMQGAQVGLQGVGGAQAGYGGATNAANALTNLGTAQVNAQLGILGTQNQFGTQDYNRPFQNVQFQQGIMSNLPFSSQTTQGYQAPPNALSQIGGLATTGLGAYGLANKAGLFNFLKTPTSQPTIMPFVPSGAANMDDIMNDTTGMYDMAQGGPVKYYASGGMASGLAGLMPDRDLGMYQMDGTMDNRIPMGQIPQSSGPMGAGIGPAFGGSNEDYVRSLYSNILNREADQGGYQHNLDLLNSGQINAQDLAGAFRNSVEGQGMPNRYQLMGADMPERSGLTDIRLNQLLGAR